MGTRLSERSQQLWEAVLQHQDCERSQDLLGMMHAKASYLSRRDGTPNGLYLICTESLMRLRAAQGSLPDKLQDYVNDLCEKIEKALAEEERTLFCQPVPANVREELSYGSGC